MNGDSAAGIELQVGDKKARVWGSDLLNLLQLLVLVIVAMGLYMHDVEAGKADKKLVEAVQEQTKVQKDQLSAQREQNCLSRLTVEQKKNINEIEFCRDLGKGR